MIKAKNWQEIRKIRSLKKERMNLEKKMKKALKLINVLNSQINSIDNILLGINNCEFPNMGIMEKASMMLNIKNN